MIDIVLVRSNSIIYDPRPVKVIDSLKKKYSLVALGWNREGISREKIKKFEFSKMEFFNLKSAYGKIYTVFYFPVFWFWVLCKLISYRPYVVHVCDIDTYVPCYVYKKIFRKKLVFELIDRYGMVIVPRKYSFFSPIVNSIEEYFSKCSEVLITTSEKFMQSYKKKPSKYEVILNCAYEYVKSKKSHNMLLKIVYTGPIMKGRGIEKIAKAIEVLEGVEFVIAGANLEKDFLIEILKDKKINYFGHLLPKEAQELESCADVIISLYDLTIPNYTLAGPNKTFLAMMLAVPLITNVVIELINEYQCGVIVNYDDINQIKSAIISLRDNEDLCKELGTNGRRAYEQKYSWNHMEVKLFNIYDELLKKSPIRR